MRSCRVKQWSVAARVDPQEDRSGRGAGKAHSHDHRSRERQIILGTVWACERDVLSFDSRCKCAFLVKAQNTLAVVDQQFKVFQEVVPENASDARISGFELGDVADKNEGVDFYLF
jgi:hypothetical protein